MRLALCCVRRTHSGGEKMLQIVLAVQLLGFILGGSAFLLRYDHV